MHATANCTANGTVRKSLASQIDRLDGLLDGLADAIPATVGDAVKQAVAEGVRAALADVLTRPEIVQAILLAAEPSILSRSESSHPSLWRSAWSACRTAAAGVSTKVAAAAQSVLTQSRQGVQSIARQVQQVAVNGTARVRKGVNTVRRGWRSLLARLDSSLQIGRLLAALAMTLAGSAARIAVQAVQGQAQMLVRQVGTLLKPLGPWAVPTLLALDLLGTVVALWDGPVLTLCLAVASRILVGGLVLGRHRPGLAI